MAEAGEGNIKVVVRCRPLNARELARGAKCLIRMSGNQTIMDPPEPGSAQDTKRATERKQLAFSFDKSYWSAGPRDEPGYCSQQTLYDDLGKELLDHGFAGFNACILACGFLFYCLGAGTYEVFVGIKMDKLAHRSIDGADKGIIPLTCQELFARVDSKRSADSNLSFTVEVSYIEIYNEKVRDLLNPKNTGNLRVREHPILGPYVEDLSKLVVNSYDEMMTLMDEGNKARTVAATNMNETSSRSHAVFTLLLTMKRHDVETNMDTEKVSRINLVDLAGSERANSTGATGQRLKEGANINKSLTTLGKVISALAMASQADHGKKGKKGKAEEFIPYRDSVLTWLLKDSLGGNSKTAMIAAISPADYEETLSTLRYADQAKKIKNKAVVNEDPNAKLVRELKEELEMLRARVSGSSGEDIFDPKVPPEKQKVTYQTKDGRIKTVTKAELQEQMEASEKLMQGLNETWEEKMKRTQEVQKEWEKALEELGISVDRDLVGVHTPKKVGRLDSEKPAAIRLSGDNILEEHCYLDNTDGKVTIQCLPDSITVGSFSVSEVLERLKTLHLSVPQWQTTRSWNGDNHVFRFNNPEEVRKQRDRVTARSNLSSVIAAGEIEGENSPRPDSPTSSADEIDVDWNFAKREAALARLGFDPALDNLPDDDLNKLYEKITKVKTMRIHNSKPSRPESSLSQMMDDVWSEAGRPFSSDATTTDDTSVHGSPAVFDDSLKDAQHQLEDRLQEMTESSAEAEDLKVEKEHMEHQLRLVRNQMRRLIDARAKGEELEGEEFEPVIYSAKQISKELGKDVSFNFIIAAGGSLGAPTSAVDTIAGLDEFGDVADPILTSSTQPSVAVKILDKRHNAIYSWSLDRMQQQLQRMRNLTTYIDRPSYTQHFSSDEPFYDSPTPEYSFIGNALISLAPLARRNSSSSTVPIFCRYTSEAIGSCRVDIKIVSVGLPAKYLHGSSASTRAPSPISGTIIPGSKMVFFLTVDTVKGLSSHEFCGVHLQVRLSSIVGPNLTSEEMFPSSAVDIENASLSDLKFRRSFSIVASTKVLNHLKQGYAPVEFFGSVKPTYLERLERWDELREQKQYIPSSPSNRTPESRSSTLPPMRRSENDFMVEQVHDVVAWLQICELGPDGTYAPVSIISHGDLDAGSFLLHQGLQRRVNLFLSSNSGQQLPWSEFTKVRAGNIRLLDAKGRTHESTSKALITLPLMKEQNVEFRPDGTGILEASALWDSSIHDSVLLNRVTAANQRVLLQFSFAVVVETCADPVHFSMDAAITIRTRDASPPSKLLTFFGSTKILSKTRSLFSVRLSPPLTRSPEDLWRVDTSKKYVRGEEVLGGWKPRGISVVEDYERLISTERRAADVQAIRVILANHPPRPLAVDALAWRADAILAKSLALWQKRFGHRGKIVLRQDPCDTDELRSFSKKRGTDLESAERLKLISDTRLIPRNDGVTKKGHLMILIDASKDIWERRWFVLRRPYLHIYTHSNELEETGIVSLSGINIESDPHKEFLLGKPFSFTLFTASNSHALAAPSAKELQAWVSKLDPTRLSS
ncbi:hypothetical protein C0995_007939 [Termitomyces sp. Mi166|nr:hypothetical protein C0995_007939 [Termitomyces sp. Mi166\